MSIGINFNSDWNQLMEESELKREAREFKEVVIKPWGKYENIYLSGNYKVKVITVNPGHRLSLQRHKWRNEHWFIVEGEASVYTGLGIVKEGYELFYAGNSLDISKGLWHRVANNQQTPLVFVEVQIGDCFEEDIERKEDDYGRTNIVSEIEIANKYRGIPLTTAEAERVKRLEKVVEAAREAVDWLPWRDKSHPDATLLDAIGLRLRAALDDWRNNDSI